MLDRGTNKVAVGCAAEPGCLRDWAIDIIIINGLIDSEVYDQPYLHNIKASAVALLREVTCIQRENGSTHTSQCGIMLIRPGLQLEVCWYETPGWTY